MTVSPPPVLQASGLTKHFPGVLALDHVDLELGAGEVVAVIGENGAGKSTLMKVLAGVQPPDNGTVAVDGAEVRLDSVRRALDLGIALIHQELNLADNLNVAANIFLGREPSRIGFIQRRRLEANAAAILDRIGLDVSPRTRVSDLSVGRQQMVEIAKALSVNARVLIMDEPTSSLSASESESLFRVIRELKSQGVSILYVSHRLAEVQELADRVVVLRDGCRVGELERSEVGHQTMVKMMVGRDVSRFYSRTHHQVGSPVLEVDAIATSAFPDTEISFTLHAGEVVAIAGLVGAGRSELLQALFGITQPLRGSARIAHGTKTPRTPADAIRMGMGLAPEDRKTQGLILDMTVRENLSLAALHQHRRLGFRNRIHERQLAAEMIPRLGIKTPNDNQIAGNLSGGNQQKMVLGKWLATDPEVLLLDEPTRGIDVGAKAEIYRLIDELASQGVGILFVSSEMDEILGISDRVLVLHQGRLAGELSREQLSEEAVMGLATGGGHAA